MLKKLSAIAAGLVAIAAVAFAAPVHADSPGQLTATKFQVSNLTTNSGYAKSVSAACGDTVKYSVVLDNSDFGLLSNVTASANLSSGAISASAKNVNGDTTSVSGSVSVSTTGTLQYVAGSTVRVNVDQDTGATTNVAEPDGITTGGVNVGNLNASTYIFVQFQAKVACETPKPIKVCDLSSLQIVTINEDQFDASKYSKDLSKCTSKPKQIKVCKLDTKTIVTIDEDKFDSSKYSKDLNDCKTTPPPSKIQVCDLTNKSIVTIDESAFDSSKYSKDLNACQTTTVTPPTELPNTGAGNVIAVFVGAIVAGTIGYRIYLSRKLAR